MISFGCSQTGERSEPDSRPFSQELFSRGNVSIQPSTRSYTRTSLANTPAPSASSDSPARPLAARSFGPVLAGALGSRVCATAGFEEEGGRPSAEQGRVGMSGSEAGVRAGPVAADRCPTPTAAAAAAAVAAVSSLSLALARSFRCTLRAPREPGCRAIDRSILSGSFA